TTAARRRGTGRLTKQTGRQRPGLIAWATPRGTEPMTRSRIAASGAATPKTAEASRLEEIHRGIRWRRWGPYLSERQWGTVREDYSENGDAWGYFPHDHARSRAYRWGEDGIGGFGDDQLLLCLRLALWNGRNPILKERPIWRPN